MIEKDEIFLKRLLATFRVEAEEHLKGISSGLLELEESPPPEKSARLLETVFREAHSLKGAARAVNLGEVESLCQALESVFAALKRKELKPSTPLFDLLQETADFLGRLLPAAGAQMNEEESASRNSLIRRLERAAAGEAAHTPAGAAGMNESDPAPVAATVECMGEIPPTTPAQPQAPAPAPPPLEARRREPPPSGASLSPPPETVRVSTAKLTSVLLKSEEMLSAKLAAWQMALDLKEANAAFAVWRKEWSRVLPLAREMRRQPSRPGGGAKGTPLAERSRALERIVEFLEWNATFVEAMRSRYADESKRVERDSRVLGGMVNNLLEDMKKVLMFPFSSLLEILPKLVRDLSRDAGKEVNLTVRGEEIEIDRRILEEMKDPLVHLVRNCVDHGIEKPEERGRKKKPRCGTIKVTVAPMDGKVELIVADDGAGINLSEVRDAVTRAGGASREKLGEMTDRELLPYLFMSGVSTSPIITELSGRGLGLAIVREKVEKLGGTVTLESVPDRGTSFRIVLPLTVATFRGLLVRAGGCDFVLPTMHVRRAVRVLREEIKTVENRETIEFGGKPLSLARLTDVLEIHARKDAQAPELLPAVVVSAAGSEVALAVDEVVNEQEVLLKGFGRQLSRVRNVAGATVLGTGKVVPILNVSDLIKSAVKASSSVSSFAPRGEKGEDEGRRRSVMVVEDSITTRTLLKNILEAAGYDVTVAVDGLDGFAKIKSGKFDAVVSDVDMPRMNGFELTAKIRADRALGELPVVLVTALASREDRERGIDVGANAYIVKGSFDQSNLLEVLNRLV